MTTWMGAPAVRAFLSRATRRVTTIRAMRGAATGFAVSVLIAQITEWPGSASATMAAGAALAVAGAFAWVWISRVRSVRIALLVERRTNAARNILVTADELIDSPESVQPFIGERVCSEAAAIARTLNVRTLFPLGRSRDALVVAAGLWLVSIAASSTVADGVAGSAARPALDGVTVTITPPQYAGLPARTLRNPASIDVLAGSRIALTVRATATAVIVESLAGVDTIGPGANQMFAGEIVADADGYIAIEPRQGTTPGERRLIGLSVTPDLAPRVRITAPARDFFLPAATRTIDVAIDSDDDLALRSLTLRYTRVSGSGEQFTFVEGDLPVQITRTDARTWKARASLRLAEMKLEAGDMIVYRAIATDARPGSPPSESDSYIVEIAAPGTMASDGFAIDEERDRYALSQQMVILKTERLLARKATMPAADFASEAAMIGAEQRQVRSEFVFMMGGELADDVIAAAGINELDETAEAEAEADLLAGRLQNQGRIDVLRAIRSMSRAATALTATDVTKALNDEKTALMYLQRAFSRTRYILRTLTQRERLDLSRRLTGSLGAIGRDARVASRAELDERTAQLRRALAGVATIAASEELGREQGARTTRFAEDVLRVDPSAEALRNIATRLNEAAAAIARGRVNDARAQLDSAASGLAAAVRGGVLRAPRTLPSLETGRLDGARVDALRRPGGER